MAEIEEAEHGETGSLFEWLQRASRAPRDPAWVADGMVSDRWAPVSPVTGQLDAFTWTTPKEQMSRGDDLHEIRMRRAAPIDVPLFQSRPTTDLSASPATPELAEQNEAAEAGRGLS